MCTRVSVGIVKAASISIRFQGDHKVSETKESVDDGQYTIEASKVGFIFRGKTYHLLDIEPDNTSSTFTLADVMIGIGFHWQRNEEERFMGTARLVADHGMVQVINVIDIEEYLSSVISSEMSAACPLELLKAHAIISRSWLLSQIQHKNAVTAEKVELLSKEGYLTRWWDHSDHNLFDVCADDHCQRYQGISRQTTTSARTAVDETRSMVLQSNGEICDARFSKCCGGILERFSSCWQNEDKEYLMPLRDNRSSEPMDVSSEDEAIRWISSSPDSFCNTTDKSLLSAVMNTYDVESTDFYRWKIHYGQDELSAIIRDKTQQDYGRIISLEPVRRGPSGRIIYLRITGSKKTEVIGKELEIRRALSPTHLRSSAFIVDRDMDGGFTLRGAGWGHGVGLCQIGAAMMAREGYSYREILSHYYPGAEITTIKS